MVIQNISQVDGPSDDNVNAQRARLSSEEAEKERNCLGIALTFSRMSRRGSEFWIVMDVSGTIDLS